MNAYECVGVGPFIVAALDVAVLGALGGVAALALGEEGGVGRGAVQVGHAHTALVLGLEACDTAARGLVQVARAAHLLEVLLVDEQTRVRVGHVGLVHGQDEGVLGHGEDLLAHAVRGERRLEDAHGFPAAGLVGRAPLAHLLVLDATTALVAVHAVVALAVEVAGVVELHTRTYPVVLATIKGLLYLQPYYLGPKVH